MSDPRGASRAERDEYRYESQTDHAEDIAEARAEARAEALADRDWDGYESDRAQDRYERGYLGWTS